MEKRIEILETPRDAMQGMSRIISTDEKLRLYQGLLQANFDILDIGSFVNPAIIPQFADMPEVLDQLRPDKKTTQLFVLVANEKGALQATSFPQINILGFPFSTSETFLKKNINTGFNVGWKRLFKINEICHRADKKLMVYLAMAFGNPYGDDCSLDGILQFTKRLYAGGIRHISLSDIIGVAQPEFVAKVYALLHYTFPEISLGLHLHVNPKNPTWKGNLQAALDHGCTRFDGVINGMGGCPMTGYELLGNLPTRHILDIAADNHLNHQVNQTYFCEAELIASEILR